MGNIFQVVESYLVSNFLWDWKETVGLKMMPRLTCSSEENSNLLEHWPGGHDNEVSPIKNVIGWFSTRFF